MLGALERPPRDLDAFVREVVPADILAAAPLHIATDPAAPDPSAAPGLAESQLLARLRALAGRNVVARSYIGCGYAGTRVPAVIQRNVLENPAWYTSYTPYQPEIAQGRLRSLLNFQTLVADLTGLGVANASVLDEPTAAAEAMALSLHAARKKRGRKVFVVSGLCHPQTLAVLRTRAAGIGVEVQVADVAADGPAALAAAGADLVGVLAQYPDTEGGVYDYAALADAAHAHGATFCVATDLLALTVLRPPGEFGADIAVGSAQRLGVPVGFGGPHAGFFACAARLQRKLPGRLVGVSKDRLGDEALRLALQTREQHIRREKATSNICTAQALLANMSAFYAVYHGPRGLRAIAQRVMAGARAIEEGVRRMGFATRTRGNGADGCVAFDTVMVHADGGKAPEMVRWGAEQMGINLRLIDSGKIGVTIDETVDEGDLGNILKIFEHFAPKPTSPALQDITQSLGLQSLDDVGVSGPLARTSPFLTHPVFNTYHSETELLRYMHHLQSKDLSLVHSMIPLGSCTMKLNATTEMLPISWPEFASIHPFAPADQTKGYHELIKELEEDLAEITGLDAVSLQPNSGAQGEFTGLRLIRKYFETQPGKKRDICLIPVSAHGTNPASAAIAGMRVVPLKCDPTTGDLDLADLSAKCAAHAEELGAIMLTYPSTYGVFEPRAREACRIVHAHGGQVYMDGANVNAQIGLCSPGGIGADVCHLNLHKTFCIPHGGGGPGVGPVAVRAHLAPFLPGHPLAAAAGGARAVEAVSGAPWGSAGILPISWAYIKMMGARGLRDATRVTLLSANYLLARLRPHYPILYANAAGRCAHEFILDARGFKASAGVEAIDIAKRLQDFGFHAPTMSWPVANTLMVEPTESEGLAELDRFCDALIAIRGEIAAVERGEVPKEGNVLKMAPHTMKDLVAKEWDRPYSREQAAYPLPWLKEKKFWPSVTRLDDGGSPVLLCSPCVAG